MNCPVCNIELRPADRGGIEIDYCTKCRGVWVAREELDRILVQPAPFDVAWSEDDDFSESDHVLVGVNEAKIECRGARPGFWTNLFDAQ